PSEEQASEPPFDAAKSCRPPATAFRSPPSPIAAVRVGFVNATMGYGLFAARDIRQNEAILHEAPFMTAYFDERFPDDMTNTASQRGAYMESFHAHRSNLIAAFPRLAARHGYGPLDYAQADTCLSNLTTHLRHGQCDPSTVTQAEYEAFTNTIIPTKTVVGSDGNACREFFRDYAFKVQPKHSSTQAAAGAAASDQAGAFKQEACVYLLGSLINHRCRPFPNKNKPASIGVDAKYGGPQGPNCEWRIGPSALTRFAQEKHIVVDALRDIRKGEELTWDYHKKVLGFICQCDICQESFM
ncbi:hypothetical protein B0T26DRAFT_609514, partial [Lasiosphaeria miniovina]